jgi:signal transduction histidine kinase
MSHVARRTSSVAPRVALVLVAVQMVTAVGAVALSARLADRRVRALAATSLRLRLESVAEEIEQRAAPLIRLDDLPPRLAADLGRRFPDPVVLVGPDGAVLARYGPPSAAAVPVVLASQLAAHATVVETDPLAPAGTWALTPIYDDDGLLAGGLLVQPLAASLRAELAPTRQAYLRALLLAGGLSGLVALALGVGLAARLVAPLRRITRGVERIGRGDYDARLPEDAPGEIGRLAASVNAMAADVQATVETLRRADRMRRELVANVGHDLRTPLAALRGYVEEARRHAVDEIARADLDVAVRQAAHLARLVDDLFELSVLEGATEALHVEPVPLGELLHEAAAAHRGRMDAAGLHFALDLATPLPVLEADGTRLLRLLDNLLGNARTHTPEGGTVTLAARPNDDAVVIEVADTGAGIDPEVIPHLFDRYWRGTDARTRRPDGSGTGLGLAIAAQIARLHGGSLSVESSPGAGSTFRLRLPLPPASETPQQNVAAP